MNKLFLLPTNETLDALRDIMSMSPVPINWDSLGVEVGSSVDPIIIPEYAAGEYRAITGEMNVWYDADRGLSSLLLTLIPSPEMAELHTYVGDGWDRPDFFPYIELSTNVVLRRNRRAFFNSVSTRFVDYPVVLTFHNETVVVSDSIIPQNNDFYIDYANKRLLNQIPVFQE